LFDGLFWMYLYIIGRTKTFVDKITSIMDTPQFTQAMRQHESPLTSYAFSLTKDYHNAHDLMQETYVRAITNSEKFTEGTNLKAWLLTIMRNIFINDYRRRVKHNTVLDKTDNLYLINSSQDFARNEAEDSFVMQDLQRAIKTLSAEYRVPFLRHHQGYKYQEIADEMRLPLGTVKSRIFFARKQIKDQLQAMGFER